MLRAFLSAGAGGGAQGQLLRDDAHSRGQKHLAALVEASARRAARSNCNGVLKEVLAFLETVR